MIRSIIVCVLFVAFGMAVAGCQSKYPSCSNSAECKAGEFCDKGVCNKKQ